MFTHPHLTEPESEKAMPLPRPRSDVQARPRRRLEPIPVGISSVGRRIAGAAGALGLALALSSCATLSGHGPGPFHDINRANFALNETVDRTVLRPAAHAYVAVVPHPIRIGIHNVFSNLSDPMIAVNEFLEGRLREGFEESGRFLANTTFGVVGLFNVASAMGLGSHHADFGLTLAHWGVPRGPYLYLPIFGPGSLRSLSGLIVDSYFGNPVQYIHSAAIRNDLTLLQLLEIRAQLIGQVRLIYSAPDPYLMMKNAYQQHRRYRFYHGHPPIVYPGLPGGSGPGPDAPPARDHRRLGSRGLRVNRKP
jgi:phospholipid-binding lipoprotein MlaA